MSELARIRRILVALDASRQSQAALEAAARMAEALEAELLGVFVEDVNLLRLAGLPFARAIGPSTARARPIAGTDMARLLRAQAARAQQALASAVAGRRGVSWSFRVARGPVAATLVEVAHETDLLALGVTYVSVTTGRRLGSTARAVLAAAPRPLLLSAAASRLGPPYALVYDGSRAAQRALAIARELVTVDDTGTLSVVLVGPQNHLGALREDLEARLAGSGIRAEYRTVSGAGPTGLMRALRACAPGSAILPAGTALLTDAALEQLLPTLRCALLIVP